MTEVELKAAVDAGMAKELPERLAGLGFREKSQVCEIDLYWNCDDRDFRKTDEALRLRSVEDLHSGKKESLITYKGPKQDCRSSTRLEYETSVGEMDTARKLLTALGYHAVAAVKKTRRSFERTPASVCLDSVEGLGTYVELEILLECEEQRETAVDTLFSLLDCLGISRDALTRESYLDLLLASAGE